MSFELFAFCVLLVAKAQAQYTTNNVWINEYKYYNIASTFLEVAYRRDVGIVTLPKVKLSRVDGSNTTVFTSDLTPSKRTNLTNSNITLLLYTPTTLSNRHPGVLLQSPSNAYIQFLSFNATVPMTAGGGTVVATYAGVSETASTPNEASIQLTGNACSYDGFNGQWQLIGTKTPGEVNYGQTLCGNNRAIASGDPHFRTFDGTKYSFHGQCDLVMTRSPSAGSLGVPLTLHARTTIQSSYSYISQAALQIGSDTLEITELGHHYVNGQLGIQLPYFMVDRYQVTKNETTVVELNRPLVNRTRTMYTILLDDGDKIEINVFKQMVSVIVDAKFPNSEGMLGIHDKVGLIGRDGETVMKDPNAMGMEWQVREDEPHLFHDMTRAPQYPERCALPKVTGRDRRMLRSNEDYKRAKNVCDDIVDSDMKEFCIEDILVTGDFNLVQAYIY